MKVDYMKESLKKHYEWRGKLSIAPKMQIKTREDLSLAYTPGVAQACLEIKNDVNKSYELTSRWNTVAVVTDGTAVLGLGDIGPEAGMPVMEGKCILFKTFADVDAIPLCIRSKDTDEIVKTISLLAGSFGGINLEDISAPRCFEVERRLKECTDIPVFHDDQHGTAIVVGAALLNALKLTKREISTAKILINGAGSAGIAICKFLLNLGAKNIIMCDKSGAIHSNLEGVNSAQAEIAKVTNLENVNGNLRTAIIERDVFIGVSAGNVMDEDMVKSMAKDCIIFAMANPTPEIMPDIAKNAGAKVVGTGRSDFANQINNLMAFPGVFRGALDARAKDINDDMKVSAAYAIASMVSDEELSEDYIIPNPLNDKVAVKVAKAVYDSAIKCGLSRL